MTGRKSTRAETFEELASRADQLVADIGAASSPEGFGAVHTFGAVWAVDKAAEDLHKYAEHLRTFVEVAS
jgi:precorrin-6B methylase 2